MNTILGGFILFVFASYVILWRMFKGLTNRSIELQRQVQEKSELLTYALTNERRAADHVTAAKESKKKLLSVINHEIRTPLNGILGMVSLLEDTSLTLEQKEYNQTIRACSENLVTTINDIFMGDALASSKDDIGKSNLEQKNFDLRNLFDEVFEVFASVTARADLELVHHIDPLVPSLLVGDSLRIRQVLMNLIENAITFTREGEIYVKVDRLAELGSSIELGFEIHDNGLGMSNDKIKLLSSDGHSASATGTHGDRDSGLLTSKRIIQSMGGQLEIENVKGKGTIAKFNLQLLKSEHTHNGDTDMSSVRGKKVLIVEDNITLSNALNGEVINWGLIPIVARSGKEALEVLARDHVIDLIVVEMQMPVMDGLMLSQAINRDYPALPIILLTVTNDEESKTSPELFSSVVFKPVKYQVLSQHILSTLINKHRGPLSETPGQTQKLTTDFAKKYPLRILIGEDNRINQKLAIKVLGKLGYDPDIAQDGKEVLEEVSKVNYDLVFMDVQMPEMDGLEATRMIRLCLSVQPVIIAMTANAMQGDREECLQAGMDDYLSKPVHVEELVIVLEKWALKIKEKQ